MVSQVPLNWWFGLVEFGPEIEPLVLVAGEWETTPNHQTMSFLQSLATTLKGNQGVNLLPVPQTAAVCGTTRRLTDLTNLPSPLRLGLPVSGIGDMQKRTPLGNREWIIVFFLHSVF